MLNTYKTSCEFVFITGRYLKNRYRKRVIDSMFDLRRDLKGYSLIELLMVTVIVGILFAASAAYAVRAIANTKKAAGNINTRLPQNWEAVVNAGNFTEEYAFDGSQDSLQTLPQGENIMVTVYLADKETGSVKKILYNGPLSGLSNLSIQK